MKRILVTGAGGFVGRPVIAHLRDQGFHIHVAHRNVAGAATGITAHAADLLKPGEAERLIEKVRPSHLIHLAWDVLPGQFWEARNNLDWLAASLRLYQAFAQSGGQRALLTGTCAEYDWTQDRLDEATTPRRPGTLYGVVKNSLFDLIMAAGQLDISFAWARLFFLYGPGEPPGRLVSGLMESVRAGKEVSCTAGAQERDFMHVDDVARALTTVLASGHQGAVNIASGDCRPVRDIIEKIGAITGRADLLQIGARPSPPNEPHRLEANVAILKGLGFAPRYSLDDGLRQTWAWWQAQSSPPQAG